jgi:hypothetical protein
MANRPLPICAPVRVALREEDARQPGRSWPADAMDSTDSVKLTERRADDIAHLYSLGSAHAGGNWRWASPVRPLPVMRSGQSTQEQAPTDERAQVTVVAPVMSVEARVQVPETIKRSMAEIAAASGRSESDLWAEAARAWLDSRAFDDEPLPPAPAAALALPRPTRSWEMIDDLLAELRQPVAAETGSKTERAA